MTREEEILNALKVLQDECKRYENCRDCPLSNDGECRVSNSRAFGLPNEWELNTPGKTWNAFRK